MRWAKRQTVLHGYAEASDRLETLGPMTCPICDSQFESVVLHLDELAFVDSDGMESLARVCEESVGQGVGFSVVTDRPALLRLLMSGPLADFARRNGGGDGGPGEAYTCPHR